MLKFNIRKKSTMKILNIIYLVVLFPMLTYSQDCTDYHQYHCPYADYTFFYSRQSTSMLFTKGHTSEIQMVAYDGEDYYIAVCAHRKFGQLHFRILEDDADRSVLFDNADKDYQQSVTFTNKSTKNLIIEVSVPEASPREEKEFRCVGVVIEFRKTDSAK